MVKNKINNIQSQKNEKIYRFFVEINPVERNDDQQNRGNSASRTR